MRSFLHFSANRPRVLRGFTCAAIALALATLSQPVGAARTPDPVPDDAMQASIDPATGRLGAVSGEDARSLSADMGRLFDRSPEMLSPIELSGGMLMVELPESYMEALVVERTQNGTYVSYCAPEREIPAVVADPGTPAILLPVWASLPRANMAAGSSGLEEK